MAILISEKDILNAATYVPADAKESIVRNAAKFCVERVQAKLAWDDAGLFPVPPLWRERRTVREMFLMGILAKFYLGRKYEYQTAHMTGGDNKDTEIAVPFLMSVSDYDEWAGSHVMNQLERMKKGADKKAVNIIFDLLYDFRRLESMLSGAIRDELDRLNDPCGRVFEMISAQSNPDVIKNAMSALEDLKKELETGNG